MTNALTFETIGNTRLAAPCPSVVHNNGGSGRWVHINSLQDHRSEAKVHAEKLALFAHGVADPWPHDQHAIARREPASGVDVPAHSSSRPNLR
jgi:hypothetical protein